jgi:outer membrane autotransporter protein
MTNGGIWNITGNSQANAVTTDSSYITFLPPDAGNPNFKTLTVSSLAGVAGSTTPTIIHMNTFFGDDTSPTDMIIINGGTAATGSAILSFNNMDVSEQGGPTVNGIRVVDAINGATTATDAFSLDKRYIVGAYEYTLVRKDDQDWYLTSYLENGKQDIRPEAALYGPIPAMARALGFETLANLHKRVGEEENLRTTPQNRTTLNGVWARAFGQHLETSFGGDTQSKVNGNLWGFQIGTDIYRNTTQGGQRDHLGVYGAYSGFNSTSVRGYDGADTINVGSMKLNGPSAGLYWTHFGLTGWYLDAVAQGSWYTVDATSSKGSKISTHATGITASLEVGYPIKWCPNSEWTLEPQAQIVYQNFNVNSTHDDLSKVNWNTADAWTARVGLRLQHTSQGGPNDTLWQPYARVNLYEALRDKDQLSFDNTAPVDTRFGGMSLEGALGMTVKVNQNTSIYGEAGYRRDVNNGPQKLEAVSGTLGVRFNW